MSTFKSPNGDGSSKRVMGSLILTWDMLISSMYIGSIQHGGVESDTTENILLGAFALGGSLLGVGVLDGWFNKKSTTKKTSNKGKDDDYERDD